MMNGWLLALLLLAMPLRLERVPELLEIPVIWSNERCHHGADACYYDGTIYLKAALLFDLGRAKRALVHEAGHYFQCHDRIWQRPGGWDKFLRLAEAVSKDDRLSDYQRQVIKAMMRGQSHDLHAELPWILGGELPPILQPWYPWLDLRE